MKKQIPRLRCASPSTTLRAKGLFGMTVFAAVFNISLAGTASADLAKRIVGTLHMRKRPNQRGIQKSPSFFGLPQKLKQYMLQLIYE